MSNVSKSKKTITTHPRTGSQFKIDNEIYAPFKAAILQSLKGSKGKIFSELTDDVVKTIRKKMPGFKGSVPWYTISVRPDLETRGIVETFIEKARPDDLVGRGKKLNRLKK